MSTLFAKNPKDVLPADDAGAPTFIPCIVAFEVVVRLVNAPVFGVVLPIGVGEDKEIGYGCGTVN